ncbi:MAG: GNAT family N-acetyltransferase [Solobacterium sp.]|nr:GNAT family N-acetyltransferase [Solobacterium sp.]
MAVKIRELKKEEYPLLRDFLYEAIFVPEGMSAPERSIIERPELAMYYENFGSGKADHCLVAETEGKVIGAVWTRIMHDYGHVDDETPSLAISLYREYRGQGIGTALLEEMLHLLKQRGYRRVSLSVQKQNRALRMYERAGFVPVKETEEEFIMIRER